MTKLRLFDVCREGTHVLGPGCRYIIWTQGCEKNCPRCITPESWDKGKGIEIDGEALASDIILAKHIDGITISGGEPFLQAAGLSKMLETVKAHRPDITIIIYSGYTIEQLRRNDDSNRLLGQIDVLIDGPYIQELNDGVGIRGSKNQRIISFTGRLDPYIETMSSGKRKVQHIIGNEGVVSKIGVPRNTKAFNL